VLELKEKLADYVKLKENAALLAKELSKVKLS